MMTVMTFMIAKSPIGLLTRSNVFYIILDFSSNTLHLSSSLFSIEILENLKIGPTSKDAVQPLVSRRVAGSPSLVCRWESHNSGSDFPHFH